MSAPQDRAGLKNNAERSAWDAGRKAATHREFCIPPYAAGTRVAQALIDAWKAGYNATLHPGEVTP